MNVWDVSRTAAVDVWDVSRTAAVDVRDVSRTADKELPFNLGIRQGISTVKVASDLKEGETA